MRKWTVLGMCLIVALSGAVAFAVTRGSDPAPAPAPHPRKATAARFDFPAHIAALPPEVRPRLFAAVAEAKPKARGKRHHAAKRDAKEPAATKSHDDSSAVKDPGLGGLSGGTPAPGGGAKPVPAPTPVPTIVPPTAQAPLPSVSVPAGTTVATVIDLITEKTGQAPVTTLPPAAPVVPDTTTVDCTTSNSGSNRSGSTPGGSGKSGDDHSGSSKDDLVTAVVQALCGDAAASGGGDGDGDDHSGPGRNGVSGS